MADVVTGQKVLSHKDLETLQNKHPDEKIVHCHGVFDVLHAGHLAYLNSAKAFGDKLVVTVTADQFVNKGPNRPYFTGAIRANMLAALEVVDYVAVSQFPTAVPVLEAIKPDLYVKGPDYKKMDDDPSGAIYTEQQTVEKHGGKLVFTSDDTHSSSNLINQFFNSWSEEQEECIQAVKDAGGIKLINEILKEIQQQKVLISGEPIVDTYVFCRPKAISSKSPCISAEFTSKEDYTGGSLAIANHLSDFVDDVSLLITHGGEEYFTKLLKERMDSRVKITAQQLNGVPTPRKTRFIAHDKIQRLFELTDLRADQWENHNSDEFTSELLKKANASDVTIVADFGHGMFEGKSLEAVSKIESFLALNVQTNSSNFGFNPFTKHTAFSFLSIDAAEARVAYQDRYSDQMDLITQIGNTYSKRGASVAVTLGPNGSSFFPAAKDGESKRYLAPAFADRVVDAIGAGDAFFAMASLLTKIGAPPEVTPFMGNVFAGLKTKILGNKYSVSKAQFIKAVNSILK